MAEWIGASEVDPYGSTAVTDVIKAAKYDLKDYGAKEFDATQMVHYLNRAIKILDRVLISLQSDQTLSESSLSITAGENSAAIPVETAINIREIWNEDDTLIPKVSAKELYAMRMSISSSTGQPRYWSHIKEYIQFDYEADDNYTFTVYHDNATATLTIDSDMPYAGRYDEYIREALILMAQAKKNKKLPQTDAIYLKMFTDNLHQDIINRNFVPGILLDF